MIKVVVDTNIIVSALLRSQSDPALIINLILGEHIILCLSKDIFAEYEEVLARPKFKQLDKKNVKKILRQLKKISLWVSPKKLVNIIKKDPDDNKFLECTLETGADFLITGNLKHFSFKKFRKTKIVTPLEFINFISKIFF